MGVLLGQTIGWERQTFEGLNQEMGHQPSPLDIHIPSHQTD